MKLFILSLSRLVSLTLQAAESRPNFIIIFTDDQGWADLGCQGVRDDVKTPHLDALAASGVRCTAGYITAPQCSPSRAGLLTGRYQQRFGLEEIADTPMPTGERTIAERLKPAGYISGMAGKWHLDACPSSVAWIKRNPKSVIRTPGKPLAIAEPARLAFSPTGQGFDEFYMNNRERRWANFRADGTSLKPLGEWITESTGDRLDDETAGALEPTLVELRDGRVWMLIRTNHNVLYKAFSHDGGFSWSKPSPTAISASSSPPLIRRLDSGRLVLVWNRVRPEGMTEEEWAKHPLSRRGGHFGSIAASWHREEVTMAFSEDDGKSWSVPAIIARQPNGWLSYTQLFEPAPGDLKLGLFFHYEIVPSPKAEPRGALFLSLKETSFFPRPAP